ncbi:APC family permease [Halobacillus sp. A5]|uniref:APC family permease n=1 Tax=Halobacillus sp. A5 TaxID=2880263 RepID=UPI0020A6AD96|nr:amino acid permease [Halobacillus sp. A5]MCP3027069.1 amino acid permease [Halobacillus sp. A5]
MEKKTIGLFQAIALYVAAILGSGVLFLSGVTASIAGPASLLSWLIVIIMSFPLAYSFACLAREFPDAGGAATFVRKSFGDHLGNITGWFYFVTAAFGQSIVALTGAFYVSSAFELSHLQSVLVAVSILLIAGITNYLGIEVSGKVALIISSCLLSLLVITVLLSLPKVQLLHFSPFVSKGWPSIGTAITVIYWAFFGWEAICNLATKFKRPHKDIVRSTLISAVIIGVLFLALSFVTIGTATYGDEESDLSPIGVIIGNELGIGAQVLTAILAFIICIGTSNAFVASLAQLGYSLGRNGAFPKQLSEIHHPSGIPRRMIVFVILFAITGVFTTLSFSMSFNDILFIPTSLGILVFIFSMAAGIKLLEKRSLSWFCSIVALILCSFVLPFFRIYIVVPLLVIGLYSLYMIIRKNILINERRCSLRGDKK